MPAHPHIMLVDIKLARRQAVMAEVLAMITGCSNKEGKKRDTQRQITCIIMPVRKQTCSRIMQSQVYSRCRVLNTYLVKKM